jgi:hypothetical protein
VSEIEEEMLRINSLFLMKIPLQLLKTRTRRRYDVEDELAKDLATSPVRYWAVVANALLKRLHL